MDSRVEKYRYENEIDNEVPSRVEKNQSLYNNIDMSQISRIKSNDNIKVIENSPKTIDIEKIKKYIESNIEEEPTRRSVVVKDDISSKTSNNLFEEKRVYDINSVLERAKEKRETYYEDEKYKKLRDTQYDILSKIEMYDSKEEEEKIEPDFNTDEKTLIDLINTVTINKRKDDMLSELRGNENTIVTNPIDEEQNDEYINKVVEKQKNDENVNKNIDEVQNNATMSLEEMSKEKNGEIQNTIVKNLDKSFYTNSMSFSKEDFEGFEELEKTVKKNNSLVKVSIIVLILLALATIFIVLKYILNII